MRLESSARTRSLAWTNPVSWWWAMLTLVSGVNIAAWILMYRQLHDAGGGFSHRRPRILGLSTP